MEEKKEFVKFDFTKRDILDSFEFYLENNEVQNKSYNEIVYNFLHYIDSDIKEAFGENQNAVNQCNNYIKKVLYSNQYLYDK